MITVESVAAARADESKRGAGRGRRENISQDLDRATRDKLMRAIRKAVVRLAEIPETYRAQLSPDDFYLPRLRYVDPAPYTEAEFERARRFMVEWDLLAPDATYDKLVANVI